MFFSLQPTAPRLPCEVRSDPLGSKGTVEKRIVLALHGVATFILRLFCIFHHLLDTEKGRRELTSIEHPVSVRPSA